MNEEIIVVGAGACGLMVAYELSKEGYKVTVLEAQNRLGGRIYTEYDTASSIHTELGAEFIHGDLSVTLDLLKKAGINYHKTKGEMWRVKYDELKQEDRFIEGWGILEDKLKELKEDMTINEFLDKYFSESKYDNLKKSVRGYASGYDTADPAIASAMALGKEWFGEEDMKSYRLENGYGKMIEYLADECKQQGGTIHLSNIVKEIQWSKNNVKVITNDSAYVANKVVITIPLTLYQADEGELGVIKFSPALPEKITAAKQMGMGAIIKVLLRFGEAFWEGDVKELKDKPKKGLGFIFSLEKIPTWWTQLPVKSSLLTGWLGGPEAAKYKDLSNEAILQMSLEALAHIFKTDATILREKLKQWYVVNWTAEPFSRGSYTYSTVATNDARKVLEEPIENTLFFAGEAFYKGQVMGTVEAALASGLEVAENIKKITSLYK